LDSAEETIAESPVQRLCGVDRDLCKNALHALVEENFFD
jgi:hypothetical protein